MLYTSGLLFVWCELSKKQKREMKNKITLLKIILVFPFRNIDTTEFKCALCQKKTAYVSVTAESPYKTSDFYIIRVSIDPGGEGERPTEGVIMYKSIMVSNHERTGSVIRSAMMKHGLEGSPDNYTLSQLLPDKGNVRMNLIRPKRPQI